MIHTAFRFWNLSFNSVLWISSFSFFFFRQLNAEDVLKTSHRAASCPLVTHSLMTITCAAHGSLRSIQATSSGATQHFLTHVQKLSTIQHSLNQYPTNPSRFQPLYMCGCSLEQIIFNYLYAAYPATMNINTSSIWRQADIMGVDACLTDLNWLKSLCLKCRL